MTEIPITREDLERILGIHVFDWQWKRLQEHFIYQAKYQCKPGIGINISKEELLTDRPNIISVLRENIQRCGG